MKIYNSLKKKLRNKELTIGSWLSFGFNQTCEIMAKAGFDWLVIDMEHTAITDEQCLSLIQIIESNNVTPLVRVGKNDSLLIKKAMDAGAHGIIVPMINCLEDAKKAIDSLYYPPIGKRGVGLGRVQDFGMGFENYREISSKETIFIPQIEHIEGLLNIESIINLELVDGFIIGPYDLSGSIGLPGQWKDQKVKKIFEKCNEQVKKSSKSSGFHVVMPNQNDLKSKIKKGYNFIAYGDDMIFFSSILSSTNNFLNSIR